MVELAEVEVEGGGGGAVKARVLDQSDDSSHTSLVTQATQPLADQHQYIDVHVVIALSCLFLLCYLLLW